MEFRILGSLEAESDGERLPLGGPSEQGVLAALLLDAGRVLSLRHLVDVLWEDDPPATAEKQVRNAVSRLRRALAGLHATDLIVTDPGGYRLAAEGQVIDSRVFEARVSAAETAASEGETARAAELLRSALALWRGPALAGMKGRIIESAAAAWDERRFAAQETYYGYELALGRHREILGELAGLTAGHPFREKLVGQHMLALYRCGRQADALAVYRATQALLAGQMGLDPGVELQQLHQQMLNADPALAVGTAPGRAPLAVPRQLPGGTGYFVGRDAELMELTSVLDRASGSGAMVAISAVGGTAGVGKTALAVHWAHRVAEQFPDGQLYVDLRGFGQADSPVVPGDAVRSFLDAFEVPTEQIPVAQEAQTALLRSLLAGKRVLMLLDNARNSEQVRPLLPGSPGCAVVVTSRNALTSLTAVEGAHPLTIGLLSLPEAHQLLAVRLGEGRVAAEPEAVRDIIASCASLPLALSIVAARAVQNLRFTLAALARELRDTDIERLDAFDGGDAGTDVRAVFSWSYRQLTAQAARLFRLLGLHPGPDVTAPVAASLAGLQHGVTRPLLAEMARAHLVTEHVPGRWVLHDLLRAYATELARGIDPDGGRQAALHRMLDHYLHTAHAAALLLSPDPIQGQIALAPASVGVQPERLADARAAWEWFEAERPVLLAATHLAASAGWDTYAYQIPAALIAYLYRSGRWHDWAATQQTALDAARRQGDEHGEARACSDLGRACIWLGRYAEAQAHLENGLALFAEQGDQLGQAAIHVRFGWLLERQHRLADALTHAEQALGNFQAASHRLGQATSLNNIGWYNTLLGDHDRALLCCEQALSLFREIGDRRGECHALDSLGYAYHHMNCHEEAAARYEQAIVLAIELGDRYAEATVRRHLGDNYNAAGQVNFARTAWQDALDILDELGHSDAGQIRASIRQLDSLVSGG